jgi:hypothetical protein
MTSMLTTTINDENGQTDYWDDIHSSVLECIGCTFSGYRNKRIETITSGKNLNAFVVLNWIETRNTHLRMNPKGIPTGTLLLLTHLERGLTVGRICRWVIHSNN